MLALPGDTMAWTPVLVSGAAAVVLVGGGTWGLRRRNLAA